VVIKRLCTETVTKILPFSASR